MSAGIDDPCCVTPAGWLGSTPYSSGKTSCGRTNNSQETVRAPIIDRNRRGVSCPRLSHSKNWALRSGFESNGLHWLVERHHLDCTSIKGELIKVETA